jgi:hypothetical protein
MAANPGVATVAAPGFVLAPTAMGPIPAQHLAIHSTPLFAHDSLPLHTASLHTASLHTASRRPLQTGLPRQTPRQTFLFLCEIFPRNIPADANVLGPPSPLIHPT